MFGLDAIDFSGVGMVAHGKKKPSDKPTPKPLPPVMESPAKSSLPKWLPWALGGAGVLVIVGILVTAKGKD